MRREEEMLLVGGGGGDGGDEYWPDDYASVEDGGSGSCSSQYGTIVWGLERWRPSLWMRPEAIGSIVWSSPLDWVNQPSGTARQKDAWGMLGVRRRTGHNNSQWISVTHCTHTHRYITPCQHQQRAERGQAHSQTTFGRCFLPAE